jgi:hypothetical protein
LRRGERGYERRVVPRVVLVVKFPLVLVISNVLINVTFFLSQVDGCFRSIKETQEKKLLV